jgi:hypothetical protein
LQVTSLEDEAVGGEDADSMMADSGRKRTADVAFRTHEVLDIAGKVLAVDRVHTHMGMTQGRYGEWVAAVEMRLVVQVRLHVHTYDTYDTYDGRQSINVPLHFAPRQCTTPKSFWMSLVGPWRTRQPVKVDARSFSPPKKELEGVRHVTVNVLVKLDRDELRQVCLYATGWVPVV